MKPLLNIVDAFPLNPTNPYSLKSLIRYIEQDKRAAIFPRGASRSRGSLMKIYPGPGLVADKSKAMVLPVRIDGAQYTPFSRMRGRIRLRWFPPITLTILAAAPTRDSARGPRPRAPAVSPASCSPTS
jgi:acyl-[acyl-carrier-protein]-phospholipid O-acyltransferase/long-chain-fatty-acid--[acyl-carrier-protein] ligase